MPRTHVDRAFKSLLFIFSCFIVGVRSPRPDEYWRIIQEYDRTTAWSENFDPMRANRVRNITCLGDSLDLKLPIIGGFNPNQVNLQKLCAKPQYGGGAPGQHAGAYCHEPPFEPFTGNIAFDISPDARASTQLQNPRVLLSCYYRCFCNWGLADASIQPKARFHLDQLGLQQRTSESTYELKLDIDDDFTTPEAQKLGRKGTTQVDSLELITQAQLSVERLWPSHNEPYEDISLDPGNKIRCSGEMPTFNLPSPYTHADFPSSRVNPVQKLCAVQLSGGSKYANAGGYCHRSDTPEGSKSEVWFSDDMTPRLDWTWTGGNFFASASIRFYCWQRCSCTHDPSKDPVKNDSGRRLWVFVSKHQLTQWSNGAMLIQSLNPNGHSTSVQVLPPQQGAGSPSGRCGVNGTGFCPRAWDEDTYGPAPHVPPNATDIVRPATDANTTVCGHTCQSLSDCGSTDSQYSCSCAFPSPDDSQKLGLDPIYPAAMCLVLFATSVTSSLGGRDAPIYVDATGVPHTCVCNETMIGAECCKTIYERLPEAL